jgi:pimeloyl-ACP methyl ester carboxylesterase
MPTIRIIETDGARLHTERRGDGPPLLLIPGGDGRAANFDAVAGMLAWDYTVLTYDRRGHARSRLTPDADGKPGASGQISMAQQSADARAVIERHGFAAAAVLGASAGALIGLDLAASSPDVVQVLVAHEPR